jgi:hypothetical protein
MKTIYEIAEMEIVAFEAEDVITTSGGLGDLIGSDEEGMGTLH